MKVDRKLSALLVVGACSSLTLSAQGQTYQPKQEVIEDFGALVPAYDHVQPIVEQVALKRVTTAVPWGRGMTVIDGDLIVLSRGRHRGEGGPSQEIIDRAGTLWRVDTSVSEPVVHGVFAGEAVRSNATVFAEPTSPPFHLYDHATLPADDVLTDRPYCSMAYDGKSRNLFICAYSGFESDQPFRKHGTDAVFRYDLRDKQWHVVEQHDPNVVPREELKSVISNVYYPHHDPAANAPPHGWANGPDGCTAVGNYLYVPAKDNHVVVQYDLDEIRAHHAAGPPNSRPVLGARMNIRHPGGVKEMEALGPSGVAATDEHLYISYRTSSVVVRVPIDETGDVVKPSDGLATADLIAVFEPWDRERKRSGNLYDIALSPDGELFVSMGREGKVWRIKPDPDRPFYGNDQTDRPTTAPPFLDLSKLVGRKTGCNNLYVDDAGYLYISSRNNDNGEGDIHGTIYRAPIYPRPDGKKSAKAATWDFEESYGGSVPSDWTIAETSPTGQMATWKVIDDASSPDGNKVLGLTETHNSGHTYNVAIAKDTEYRDLDLTVYVKALSGREDQGGGPIWRCVDKDNYYICRFNPLESNYRVYVVKDGKRRELASATLNLESDRWYKIGVQMRDADIACSLDDKVFLRVSDTTISTAGMIGLWTKADAVTSFDNLSVRSLQGE